MGLLYSPLRARSNVNIHLFALAALVSALFSGCAASLVALPTPTLPIPSATLTATVTPFLPLTDTPEPPPTATPTNTPTPETSPTTTLIPETPTQLNLYVYVFPVQPPEIASFSQGHHDYPATDIYAPTGSRFVAVTDGIVDFVSSEDLWNPAVNDPAARGGLSVAIIGNDGVRYYGAHLSAIEPGIAVGVRVSVGQTLGYIGTSGNARGLSPHLHFGISHPTTPDDWAIRRGEVDPYPYLLDWENGVMSIPLR